jgi:hypothetical protein
LDSLWLLFASFYAMWLVLGGLAWTATTLVAFGAFKLALASYQKLVGPGPSASRGLTFLRVFSRGRRSERMLDALAKYWRHVGSVQIITGPDVSRSTVQPHQFLDFLAGKLGTHFVRDPASLERSVADWDRGRSEDGRFRINNFFCHADSWQSALPRFIQNGDVALMDLRCFSASNAGCVHELKHLVANVPSESCLLLVDATTDAEFLERTLRDAWQDLPPDSPNVGRRPEEVPQLRPGTGVSTLKELVRRLSQAGAREPAGAASRALTT